MVQNVVTSIILYSGTAVDLLIILMSVSYTHLDVYKRQVYARSAADL